MVKFFGIVESVLAIAAVSSQAKEIKTERKVASVRPWVSGTPDTDPACIPPEHLNDPGAIGTRMTAPKLLGMGHTGACIDESTRRPLIPLSDEERARFAAEPDEIVVGNWSYIDENGERGFGVAKYRASDVMAGGVWKEPFDEYLKGRNPIKKGLRWMTKNINHLAQVSCFKPGKSLMIFPDNGSLMKPPMTFQCMVFSGEAVPIVGTSSLAPRLLLLEGLKPKRWGIFATTMRGLALPYKFDEVLKPMKKGGMGRSVDFIPMTEKASQDYAANFPKRSGEVRNQLIYGTFDNSCVGVFNSVIEMGMADPAIGAKERKMILRSPGRIVEALKAMGALDTSRPVLHLEASADGAVKVTRMDTKQVVDDNAPPDEDPWALSKFDGDLIGPEIPLEILKKISQ